MDYKEYGRFIKELTSAGVTEKKTVADCMREKFDYLAEDEVEIILRELL